jgi:uncharacterized protein YndB with AHSA1/START domain
MSRRPGETGNTLRIERTFRAPARAVFEAWTSAEVLRRWWHAEHAWETPTAEVDPRVGGAIRLVMRNPADGTEYAGRGEYTLLDPPRRLAFTWAWESEPSAQQLVEVEFIDHGDRTTVVLTHTGLPGAEADDYRVGWQNSFDNLDATLAG